MNGKQNQTNARIQSIDFLRLLFSCIIVYFHILHENIMSFTGENPIYVLLANKSSDQGIIVEFFLLVGGFFLYRTMKSKHDQPMAVCVLDRAVRLWPAYAVYCIFNVVMRLSLHQKINWTTLVMDLLMFRCTGISTENTGIIWYVGPFFWATLLVIAILRTIDRKKIPLVLGVLVYFGYALNFNLTNGYLGREIVLGFVSLGFFRVLAGLSLGVLLGLMMDAFRRTFPLEVTKGRWMQTSVYTILEIGLLGFLMVRFFSLRLTAFTKHSFVYILIFAILIPVLTAEKGLFSKVCSRLKLGFVGKYSYAIYVMQQLVFSILKRSLWKQEALVVNHPYLTCIISVLIVVIAGVAVYYIIEQPVVRAYRKWKTKRMVRGLCDQSRR